MPTPKVIDLSHHNTIPESLEPAAASGILGVIHKLTEGTSFVDSKVLARYVLAQEAGLAWGLYHFVRPGDMDRQARFFFDSAYQLGVADGNTLWALDWEDEDVSADDAVIFMCKIEELTGRQPVLYSGHVLKEACAIPDERLTKYRLWLAQYASSCTLPAGWQSYWLWQYSQEATVPGVTPPTDVNAYDGEDDDLLEEWSGRAEPEEAEVVITVKPPPGVKVRVVIDEPETWD